MVENGLKFRNEFHLDRLSTADVFIPCGGRPEAVDIANVGALLKEDGTPRFKYIVEGANLFFTQEARLRLEKAGCVIFKVIFINFRVQLNSRMHQLTKAALQVHPLKFWQH